MKITNPVLVAVTRQEDVVADLVVIQVLERPVAVREVAL